MKFIHDPLFEAYLEAEELLKEVSDKLLSRDSEYRLAVKKRDEAWEKCSQAKTKEAGK